MIDDLVGYGSANCSETAPTGQLSNTTAALRNGNGAADTDHNFVDFTIAAPNPRAAHDSSPKVISTFPAAGSMTTPTWATINLGFNEPVNVTGAWYSIQCTVSGTHSATVSGGPVSFTLNPDDPFNAGESCTVTVSAPNVTDVDVDDPPDAMLANHVLNFTVSPDVVCGDPATLISSVQGSGTASPVANSIVEIEGVVVGAFPGTTGFQGLHVQEQDSDRDGNAATSEGIFVFEPNGGATYAVGDTVRVKGQVVEFNIGANQTLTELSNLNNLDVCSSGSSVTPTPIEIPFASGTFAERYEGMLVEFPTDHDMVVTETFNFGRFGELILTTDERQWTPTHLVPPGDDAIALQTANNLDRIVLDDGRNDQNIDPTVFPDGGLSASNTIRVGDTVEGGSFVFEQRFSAYRLQPTADRPEFVADEPAPGDCSGCRRRPAGRGDERPQLLHDLRLDPRQRQRAEHLRAVAPRMPRRQHRFRVPAPAHQDHRGDPRPRRFRRRADGDREQLRASPPRTSSTGSTPRRRRAPGRSSTPARSAPTRSRSR